MTQPEAAFPRVRRNQAWMWRAERLKYAELVLESKDSFYDWYIDTHTQLHQYHGGPAFLPWHRQFIFELEEDLRTLDSSATLPYWDWTLDRRMAGFLTPWTLNFMGGNGTDTGIFTVSDGWLCRNVNINETALRRQFGAVTDLPTGQQVDDCLGQTPYDRDPWDSEAEPSFRNYLEGGIGPSRIHNAVHNWVGGNMRDVLSSPNDPVFFLHHANIDRIWGIWQDQHPTQSYVPQTGGPAGHNGPDKLLPRGKPAINDVTDRRKMGYVYDTDYPTIPSGGSGMLPGDVLVPGTTLYSAIGGYQLDFQANGQLGLYNGNDRSTPIWAAPRVVNGPGRLVLEPSGTLDLYDKNKVKLFTSGTSNMWGNRLYVTYEGELALFNMLEQIIWSVP
ncbi:tyrosinase family protein [Kitasatospora sp. NBC_01287]|uniref:tyrosinase family protein n=1 Tax=Kitasatospora sp. NBC_01287 TaxID=2903573 RepID=UPI00225327DD|nr:tyrosinase family protein [Kitasatospora sp. NBC_01287]MCX4749223.1 tyrosinase family protein [Kitasatospora sp. NBC_01287]